jgi:hypothetical protein
MIDDVPERMTGSTQFVFEIGQLYFDARLALRVA